MSETLAFGEYRPDVNALDSATATRYILNVLARGDGYGPIPMLSAFSAALGATCRGFFYSRDTDGTINVFAGTSTELFQLDNTSLQWTNVTKDTPSTYSAMTDESQWQFAQFGNYVVAVNSAVDPQVYDITSSTEFDDLSGSPPRAAYVAVVGRFLVLSGLASNPYRTHWSGLGDVANWTAGTGSSDFQDAPDGGIVRQVLGGEVGFILQDSVIRRMIFSGGEIIFTIEKIAKDIGLLHPYAACTAGDKIFFLTAKGFMQTDQNGSLLPIGAEKVDRTFLSTYDASMPRLVLMAADPNANIVVCAYRSLGASEELFDRALVYNYLLQRWTPFEVSGEFVASVATPGITLEALGAIAPGAQDITGIAEGASSKIRITVADTSDMTTGDYKTISGVTGSFGDGTEVNDTWEITVISGTTFDLNGSTINSQNVLGTADNGSGKVRIEVASTASWSTGDKVLIASVGGTTEANGNQVVTVVDATHLDLTAVNFVNPWTSGGTVKDRYDSATDGGIMEGSIDDLEQSLDAFSTGTLARLAFADSDHKIAFLTGDNLEAVLETTEMSGQGKRLEVDGFEPITDSATVYGQLGKRETLHVEPTYTSESTMNSVGYCPNLWSTKYVRGRVRIPSGEAWTYATGVRPKSKVGGEH
jgi:hypothetical protein